MNPQQSSNPIIHQLPNFLIDQIKAGEVVERPSQAIKEIIENSIDAQSTRIALEIKENGLDLISCSDNGVGISFSQLPIAFMRHATSKINRYEDLFRLDTFGFRGEALASVAAISRLSCFSKPKNNEESGGKISYAGGEQVEYFENEALPAGTTLSIENLFFNTPARLKFIRSKQSEKNAINKIINSFLFSNFKIDFSIKWDEQDAKVYPACKTEKERVEQIFSRKKNNQVLDFSIEHENYKVHGYYSLEANKGTQGKFQYLFINNRYFQDKSIHQVILRSLEYIWGAGLSGHYCIYINAPKDQIDVNVHPSKTFIKFQNPSLIHSLIGAGLKQNKPNRYTNQNENSHEKNVNVQSQLSFDQKDTGANVTNPSTALNSLSNSNVFFLDKTHVIFKKEDESYILNLKKLLMLLFENKIKSGSHKPQALLVAIPLNNISNQTIKTLNQSSFHIETISTNQNETVHLCRAVPLWLLEIGVNPFLQLIIDFEQDELLLDMRHQMYFNQKNIIKISEQIENLPHNVLQKISMKMIQTWLT